jgi:uncharacterized membrane protein YoaK (UPF0700 family)
MKHQATLLAAIAGYVDTLGFVALFGLFTVHVTGNFVLIGAQLVGAGTGIALKLSAFPAFIAGLAFAKAIAMFMKGRAQPIVIERTLLGVQAALLCAFLAAGLAALPIADPDSMRAIVCGMCGAFAMSVQNATPRLVAAAGVPTTVMTGNVTQAVLDSVDLLFEQEPQARAATRRRLAATFMAVVGFALGAICGAFAFSRISFWGLVLPVALLILLALTAKRDAPPA